MAIVELSMVVGAIVEMGVEAIWDRTKRREAVIKVLRRAGLKPDAPPPDFDGVYTYTLVEYGIWKPRPVLDFFRHEFIRNAFRQSFERGDPSVLQQEAETLIEWHHSGQELRQLDIDPRTEFARFTAVFNEVLDRSLTPGEVRRERKLNDISDDLHRRTSDILERLEGLSVLQEIRTELARLVPTEQQLSTAPMIYLKWIIDRSRYVDPRGTFQVQRQVQLRLDEVYVSLRAQVEEAPTLIDRHLLEQDLALLEKQLVLAKKRPDEMEDRREQIIDGYRKNREVVRTTSSTAELSEVVTSHDRLVILGDPGSGKTTLLRYLALQHAQMLCKGAKVGQMGGRPVLGRVRFPIFLRIAEYAERDTWRNRSLSEFIAESCIRAECSAPNLRAMFDAELSAGGCLILVDGLDEVIEADDRRRVVERLEDFVRRYDQGGIRGQNSFVVTSRIAGYRSAPLAEPFAHYVIQEMDEDQIERFLQRWCRAVEDAQTPDVSEAVREQTARREVNGVLKAVKSSPGVRRLAANPLMLRTLALIHRTGAQLPQRRIELYKLAAETLAYTWRTAQGVPASALVNEPYLTLLLGKMAYWLHSTKQTGIASEREVHLVLGEGWARIERREWQEDEVDPVVRSEVGRFLLAVREHTGLFVERAPRRYGFMHLTFQEYYAARHLVARPRRAAMTLRQHLHDPRWTEPILLALGFVGMDYPEEAADLVETAILAHGKECKEFGIEPDEYEDLLGRDFLFALRCMGDHIPMNRETAQQVLQRFISELILTLSAPDSIPLCFGRYRTALWERVEYLAGNSDLEKYLAGRLRGALQDKHWDVIHALLRIIDRTEHVWPEVSQLLLNSLNNGPRSTSFGILHSVQDLTAIRDVVVDKLVSVRDDCHQSRRARKRAQSFLDELEYGAPEDEMDRRTIDLDVEEFDELFGGLDMDDASLYNFDEIDWKMLDMEEEGDKLTGGSYLLYASLTPEGIVGSSFDDSELVMDGLAKIIAASESMVELRSMLRALQQGEATPAILGALAQALCCRDSEARKLAAGVLLYLEDTSEQVLAALLDALQDNDLSTRQFAAVALAKRGIIRPEILEALADSLCSGPIRWEAANTIGRVGYAEPKIIADLLCGLTDVDKAVSNASMNALVSLGKRFPNELPSICSPLAQIVRTWTEMEQDVSGFSGREYAYEALWMLLAE